MSQDISDECEKALGAVLGSHVSDTHIGESTTQTVESKVSAGKQSHNGDQILAESSHSKLPKTKNECRLHCDTCMKQFRSKRRLEKHCKACKILNFCDICGIQIRHLIQHRVGSHSKLPIFNCRFCAETGMTRTSLLTHLQTHKDNFCRNCGKRFTTAAELNEHLEKRFQCKVCGRCFKSANVLKMHEFKLVRGKIAGCQPLPYSCEICKEQLEDLFALTSHMRTHRGPVKSYIRVKQKLERQNTESVSAKQSKLTGDITAVSGERHNIVSAEERKPIGVVDRKAANERQNTKEIKTTGAINTVNVSNKKHTKGLASAKKTKVTGTVARLTANKRPNTYILPEVEMQLTRASNKITVSSERGYTDIAGAKDSNIITFDEKFKMEVDMNLKQELDVKPEPPSDDFKEETWFAV